MTLKLVSRSLAFYRDERHRQSEIKDPLRQLVDRALHSTEINEPDVKTFKLDGAAFATCEKFPDKDPAVTAFCEIKNSVGSGGCDPIHQAECDYYSANRVRFSSLSCRFV